MQAGLYRLNKEAFIESIFSAGFDKCITAAQQFER
jgi:hypothetical protein